MIHESDSTLIMARHSTRLFAPARELAELKNFSPVASTNKNPTIAFPQPPCVVLNALEVLGFKVVSCTSASDVIVWTLWDGVSEALFSRACRESFVAAEFLALACPWELSI